MKNTVADGCEQLNVTTHDLVAAGTGPQPGEDA